MKKIRKIVEETVFSNSSRMIDTVYRPQSMKQKKTLRCFLDVEMRIERRAPFRMIARGSIVHRDLAAIARSKILQIHLQKSMRSSHILSARTIHVVD